MLPIANKVQKKSIRLDFSALNANLVNRFNSIVAAEEAFAQTRDKKNVLNVNKSAMDLILLSSSLIVNTTNKKENDEQL